MFEGARQVTAVLFDKTGTLTTGVMTLSDVVTDEDPHEFLHLAASLEAASGHPIGKAVALGADSRDIQYGRAENLESHAGLGITGRVDGLSLTIGKPGLLESRGLLPNAKWSAAMQHMESEGKTAFLVGWDGNTRGVIAVADELRPGAAEAVARLSANKIKSVMVTGDNRATAEQIASLVNISEVESEVLPTDKAEIVIKHQDRGGSVAFVGDGINDAVALTVADLGMAIGSGTDVALEAGRGGASQRRPTIGAHGHRSCRSHLRDYQAKPVLGVRLQRCRHPARCSRIPQPHGRRGGHGLIIGLGRPQRAEAATLRSLLGLKGLEHMCVGL